MPSKRFLSRLAAALALAAALLWPGDAPWIYDEPRVLSLAWDCLRKGAIPWAGIPGSRAAVYGPFPAWVYMAGLALTRDLVALVALHALAFWAIGAACVWRLARLDERLEPSIGAAALLSPYLWLYGRMLWDNTFLIPLSAGVVVLYLSFARDHRPWKLALAALGGALMLQTHLMALAFVVPLAVHAAWRHGAWLCRRKAFAAGLAAGVALFCAPYLWRLWSTPAAPADGSLWRGWLFPLTGGRLLSGAGVGYFLGSGWRLAAPVRLAATLSAAAVPLAWAGLYLAARRVAEGLRSPERRGAAFDLGLLGLGTVLAQCVLCGLARAYGHPHYLAVGWFFDLYFVWLALSALPRGRGAAATAYGACLAAVTLSMLLGVHARGGNRDIHYGPTLANQLAVARQLDAFRPGALDLREAHFKTFPIALAALVDIYGIKGDANAEPRELAVVYASGDPADGRIALSVGN